MEKDKLLLLPGWGMSCDIWKDILPFLEQNFEIYKFDWYGIYDTESFKERIYSFVDKNFKRNFLVMAWSMGSLLALDLASKYNTLIKHIILISGTSKFINDKKSRYLCGWPDEIIKKMVISLKINTNNTLISFYKNMFTKQEIELGHFGRLLKIIEKQKPYTREELEAGLKLLISEDNRDVLKNIKSNILLIHGEKDSICRISSSLYIKEHFLDNANVILENIEDSGHIPFLTNPEVFKEIIIERVIK